jgi:hypothetical protein
MTHIWHLAGREPFDSLQCASSLSLAMGLTTFLTTILGWFTEIHPSVKAIFSTRIGRLRTSLDKLPMSGGQGLSG